MNRASYHRPQLCPRARRPAGRGFHPLIIALAAVCPVITLPPAAAAYACDAGQIQITAQPAPADVATASPVTLSVSLADGVSGVSYRWSRNGVDLVNGPAGASPGGGTISGATGSLASPTSNTVVTFTITGARPSDSGRYALRLWNPCGTAISTSATVRVGWRVTTMHPAASTSSQAEGGSANDAVGAIGTGAISHACRWDHPGLAPVDLHPASLPGSSYAFRSRDGKQVGAAEVGRRIHAALWRGTAGSWIDLAPAGSTSSEACDLSGTSQVGHACFDSRRHAGMWSGTANSWLDLNPPGAQESAALGIDWGIQAGYAMFSGNSHAGTWAGSSDTWLDLNPSPSSVSIACATRAGMQVGAVDGFASLWTGTPQSVVLLHPTGAVASCAANTDGNYQVGRAYFDDGPVRAGIWHASAASWLDLAALLPDEYSDSTATGIWTSGTDLVVSGTAYNTAAQRPEAILWQLAKPACPTDLNQDGVTDIADLTLLLLRFGQTFPPGAQPADINADGIVDVQDLTLLLLRFGRPCPPA